MNPSFERGLDGYTGRSTVTSVVEVSVPHSGTRALKVDPGNVTPGQYIPFVQGRTYEIGVWVKEPGATTDNGAGNNKLRIGNSAGQPVFERPYNSGTVGTNWTLISGRWKATETASLPVTLSNYLISGSRYFDDFYVTDVTDRVDIDATAGAVTGLTSRVSTAEGAITSQSQQLTNLQNSLNTTNSNVSKKADATALTSVDNRVTEAEGKLTTQSQQLTNLANVLTATRNAGDNLIPNFDFLQGSTAWDIQYPAGVTFGDFGDGKAGVRLNRTTTTSPGIFSNNNKPVPLNGQRKYRVVVKAKGVSGAMSLLIRRQNKIGQTDSTYEDKTVTLTTDWQTITWETGLTAAGADGQNFKLYSHPTNGEIWLDSVRVFDITDETNIKATSDAVSSLTGTVTNQGNTLTSQGQSITALNNALEGVKGDVAKKADASAVSSLTNRVSLFNRNNATAVPVMIAEGNELYIDTARIKNSSLTSTKIADGSITNAKIGNVIQSNDYVDGSRGWSINKDGGAQFNNGIFRGHIEAASGTFKGTLQADSFIGDIAVAKGYDSLTFRRNQSVQRNGAYQNRGYGMTVVLACTLVCQTYGTGNGLGYTSDITFNIGGQEVTRRIFVDAGNITAGTTAFELRFAARLDADYNNVGFFIKATGRNAAIDYTCTVENITATAFRTDSSSFS